MRKSFFLYAVVISIPLALGILTWQSVRFAELKRTVERNDRRQMELIEQNRRLITEISALTASARIGKLADSLGLDRKRPEDVMHISIRK